MFRPGLRDPQSPTRPTPCAQTCRSLSDHYTELKPDEMSLVCIVKCAGAQLKFCASGTYTGSQAASLVKGGCTVRAVCRHLCGLRHGFAWLLMLGGASSTFEFGACNE